MKVEVISIGDELLIGQTINTNASWIGAQLNVRGAVVEYCSVIKDDKAVIKSALDLALSRVDVVIITGGLGPTKDDITKYALSEYFNSELEMNEEVLEHVKSFFAHIGKEMLDVNIQQAALPKAAKVLKNEVGTASGMWFEKGEQVVISLPGVPYEMKQILSDSAFDMLGSKYGYEVRYNRNIHLQGIGESFLAERIKDIESEMHANNIGLAYLPSPGLVRLRLTGTPSEDDKDKIADYIERISLRLPQYVFGNGENSLSKVVGDLLIKEDLTLGTVESCTGGAMANEIVSIAGASQYFRGSFVSYANEIKTSLVGINKDDINKHGAVSETIVKQMAQNGREKLNVDYCLSTSGIAGPNGGTEQKPVGLVWIGMAGPSGVVAKKFQFGNARDRNVRRTILTALNLLRCDLLKINIEKS